MPTKANLRLSKLTLNIAVYSLICGTAVLQSTPGKAQDLSPLVLSEIREAPFSRVFSFDSGAGYAVKDRDYDASESKIGFFSLWGDIPSQNRFGVAVQYCVSDQSIADDNLYLAEMVLLDKDQPLVTINQPIKARTARLKTVESAQYIPAFAFVDEPFYDPFWNPYNDYFAYAPATYLPPVACSHGSSRFDLSSVKQQIAQLPDRTLQVKLIFNNGITQNWQLGKRTVKALKELPAIKQVIGNPSEPPAGTSTP